MMSKLLAGFDWPGLPAWKSVAPPRRRALTALLLGSLLLTVDFYHDFTPSKELDDVLLFLLVPLAAVLLRRESPRRYGLALGRWRLGLWVTLAGCLLMLIVAAWFAAGPAMTAYYVQIRAARAFWPWLFAIGAQMFAWEFFFRGFILFGLLDEFEGWAVPLQAVLFMVAHWGKPEIEVYTSLLGGLILGWAILRVRAFWPAWIIHWFLDVAFEVLVRGGFGP